MEPALYRLRHRLKPWEVDRVLREGTVAEVEAMVTADVWNREREEDLIARLGAWVQDGFGAKYEGDAHPEPKHLIGRDVIPSDPRYVAPATDKTADEEESDREEAESRRARGLARLQDAKLRILARNKGIPIVESGDGGDHGGS